MHAGDADRAVDCAEGDRLLAVVPMFHANAWGLPYAAMLTGASLVMPDRFLQAEPLASDDRGRAGDRRPAPCRRSGTTCCATSTSTRRPTSPRLRSVIVGGSACPPALMRAFRSGTACTVLHAWGMTEMSPLGTVAVPPSGADRARRRGPTGRPRAGSPSCVEARLVGPDGAEVPWDGRAVGELEVRGPWITGSYYRDDDPGASSTTAGCAPATSGTLTPDGFLRLTDRAKDVIKSGGEWISSVELENHLMAHPKVKEASVVGVPDEQVGRAAAGHGGRAWTASRVDGRRSCGTSSPTGWRTGSCPSGGRSSTRSPRPASGKFDKKVLRQRYADGQLDVKEAG